MSAVVRSLGLYTAAIILGFALPLRAEVVIGLAISSTGPKVAFGEQIRADARKEVAKLNSQGGIHGEPVALLIDDDACTADGGSTVAAKFVAAKTALVLGHPCSNAAIVAAKTYAAANITYLALGARHPDLTAKRAGPTIFRLGGRDDQQAADTVAEFADQLKGTRVALVHDRTAYAKGLADGVMAGLKSHGVGETIIAPIVAGEKDYSALIQQLKIANVAAIYFAGFPNEAELIVDGLHAAGVAAALIGCDALVLSRLRERGVRIMAPIVSVPLHDVLAAWAKLAATGAPSATAVAAAWRADKNGDLPGRSYRPTPALP